MAPPPSSCQLCLSSSSQRSQCPCLPSALSRAPPAASAADPKSIPCDCKCAQISSNATADHHSSLVPAMPVQGTATIPLAPPPRLSMLGAASTSVSIGILSPHAVPLPPTPISLPPGLAQSTDPIVMDTCQVASQLRRGRCSKPASRSNTKDSFAAATAAEIEDTLDLPSSSTWLSTDRAPTLAPATGVAVEAASAAVRRRTKSRRAPSRTSSILPTPATHPSPISATSDANLPLSTYPSTLSLTRRRLTSLPLSLLVPHPTPHAFAALHTLDLSRNRLTTLPAALSDLANLRHLNLAHNHLTTLPRLLCAFEYLESLILSQNQLTGSLPPWLGYLTHLQVLKVDCNQFSGSVPMSWSALKRLQVLALGSATYGGNLLDSIPEGVFAHMHALKHVDLASNPLQHLPRDLFSPQLKHLTCVNVEGNKLDTLPDTIHLAPNLSAVYAANNLLCRLPRSIMQCPKLEVLDLSGNALCFVPMELIVAVHRRRVTVLLTGNPFTRFHEVGHAVERAVGGLVSEEEHVNGAGAGQSSNKGDFDDDGDAMDVDRTEVDANSVEHAHEHGQPVYTPSDRDRAYVHPDAIDFNPQPAPISSATCSAAAAYPSPPSTPHLDPHPLAGRSTTGTTAATATPPLLRVPISLRELAARKSLDLDLCPDALAAHLPPRLMAMLDAAHGAQCPRCASPVVGEYLATVEVERVLGHALVPVRKLYCSTECLVGREADEGGGERGAAGGSGQCCGLGVNCCRVGESRLRHGNQVVLPGAAAAGTEAGRPLGMIPANVVRSCLW